MRCDFVSFISTNTEPLYTEYYCVRPHSTTQPSLGQVMSFLGDRPVFVLYLSHQTGNSHRRSESINDQRGKWQHGYQIAISLLYMIPSRQRQSETPSVILLAKKFLTRPLLGIINWRWSTASWIKVWAHNVRCPSLIQTGLTLLVICMQHR